MKAERGAACLCQSKSRQILCPIQIADSIFRLCLYVLKTVTKDHLIFAMRLVIGHLHEVFEMFRWLNVLTCIIKRPRDFPILGPNLG